MTKNQDQGQNPVIIKENLNSTKPNDFSYVHLNIENEEDIKNSPDIAKVLEAMSLRFFITKAVPKIRERGEDFSYFLEEQEQERGKFSMLFPRDVYKEIKIEIAKRQDRFFKDLLSTKQAVFLDVGYALCYSDEDILQALELKELPANLQDCFRD